MEASFQATQLTNLTKSSFRPFETNYVVNIDNDKISARQTTSYVGNFYKKLVHGQILRTQNPSPILKQEEKSIRRYQSPFKKV